MKIYDNLEDMVHYILKKHKNLRSATGGVNAYKMLRKPDGRRITFEEVRGFRIIQFQVLDTNTLSVNAMAAGYAFRGQQKQVVSSQLFLQDLVMVNVYDHRAEFFTRASIDFTYITRDKGVDVQMLQEWIEEDSGILRAQWVLKDKDIEKILDEISIGRKVEVEEQERRHIDMTFEEF